MKRIYVGIFLLCVLQSLPVVFCKCQQFIAVSRVTSAGNITSPGWPAPYPPDAVCDYKLQGENWQGVKIQFHHFDLEKQPDKGAGCLNDYVELNTVDTSGQRTFRGRFCGRKAPGPILLLHPVVELIFRSNHASHHTGFSASYEFVDESDVTTPRLNATSPCGEVVQGIGGLITDPGFPKGYVAGLDCLWLIRVKYDHAIYLRVQHLEFQGSTANCQKAQLRIYDGYEHSLTDESVIKKFCGDTRYYKGEEDKVILSYRNRLLIRFTTTEPSKPMNDSETNVGFQLVWSDVEFNTPGNCTKSSRFACQEAQICFTHNHTGGTSSCPDLRHYCIDSKLMCDGVPHCGELNSSDEEHCSKTPLVLTVVATPLAILTSCLFICFLCYKRSSRKRERQLANNKPPKEESGTCYFSYCCVKPQQNKDSSEEKCHPGYSSDVAPILRVPIGFERYCPRSPNASDIVSPASGFSDSESDLGNQAPIFCPAHGPVTYVPIRYLPRPFPLLPVVQEAVNYPPDIYDEGGSIYSTSQNSDMVIYEDKGMPLSNSTHNEMQMQNSDFKGTKATSTGLVQEWRLRQLQRRVQRSDAVYISDDNKSSIASSPGRICPRCLEKEKSFDISKLNPLNSCLLEKHNSGVQFDSGIDVVDNIVTEPVKNVSFETCTSSDSAISQGFTHYRPRLFNWKDKFCQPPMVEEVTQTDPNPPEEDDGIGDESRDVFCETVTTFGVNPEAGNVHVQPKSKATDV